MRLQIQAFVNHQANKLGEEGYRMVMDELEDNIGDRRSDCFENSDGATSFSW